MQCVPRFAIGFKLVTADLAEIDLTGSNLGISGRGRYFAVEPAGQRDL